MTDVSQLREIVRLNIRNIKEVADALINVREMLLATQETVEEVLHRVERLEGSQHPTTSDGVKMYAAGSNDRLSENAAFPELDVDVADLTGLILQHPSWLRPFSVLAEIEKHQLESETLRLRRTSSGYLRVIRLTNGTEWAYFEAISNDRFTRLKLLSEVFDPIAKPENWMSAWVSQPVKLQSLQKGARWEILVKGKLIVESNQ